MPLRPLNRDQAWLLPPTLGDLIPNDHPVRFVAGFVDELDREDWIELEIDPDGEQLGAPAYHPRALLSVWLYGFMTGTRSSRKLEAACRDHVPYLWLTGWQRPDHNTLWRFYQVHRQAMRRLLKFTVATAMDLKLIDLTLQAVDGTKIWANAARDQNYTAVELQRLLDRTEAAITEMERQNEEGNDASPLNLHGELQEAQVLKQKVRDAINHLKQFEGLKRINLTDEDAQLMKGRDCIVTGYNAQAVVSPLSAQKADAGGMLITAVNVVNTAADSGQLVPMLEQAEEMTGERVLTTVADGGYNNAANLEAGKSRGQTLVMAERFQSVSNKPYFKDQFRYNVSTDSYICPEGHSLHFTGFRRDGCTKLEQIRLYSASRTDCHKCSAHGVCTKYVHGGRRLWIGNSDLLLREHRQWMKTDAARRLYAKRQQLIEPAFGILKEQMGFRRFLLRGLTNVRAEFALLATAFNLRVLSRIRIKSSVPYKMISKPKRMAEIKNIFDAKSNLNLISIIVNVYAEIRSEQTMCTNTF